MSKAFSERLTLLQFIIGLVVLIGSVGVAWANLQNEVRAANERATRAEQAVVTFGAELMGDIKDLKEGISGIDRRLSRIEGRLEK